MSVRTGLRWWATALMALGLAACSGSVDEADAAPEPGEDITAPITIQDLDPGDFEWVFRPGGNVPETVSLQFVKRKTSVDGVAYELGEPVYADVTADGRVDAAIPVTATDGNGFEEHWYLWIATDEDPVQVTLPIARTARCGTVTKSVTAEAGAFVVHEIRRHIGEDSLACADEGTDERTRLVSAIQARNEGEWWPVQTGPLGGFGGLCPVAADYDAVLATVDIFAAPDRTAPEATGGEELGVFNLEPWPVYGEDFGDWRLVGFKSGDRMGCGWINASADSDAG